MKRLHSNSLQKTRVDFTPFVSVAFVLLCSFFALETLSKPNVLLFRALDYPSCGAFDDNFFPNHQKMVVVFLDEKEVYMLVNPYEDDAQIKSIPYELFLSNIEQQKQRVSSNYPDDSHGNLLTVSIKPLRTSNYGQFVKILNDLQIAHISRYALVPDLFDTDREMLAKVRQ